MSASRRHRLLIAAAAVVLSVSALSAPSASAHQGMGNHFFCDKFVPARGYCSGWDGVVMGVFAPYGFMSATPLGNYPRAEVCVIDDMYDRFTNAHVRRYKVCGVGGAEIRLSDIRAQGGYPAGYNGLRFFEVVSVYNRESHSVAIGGGAIGYAQY